MELRTFYRLAKKGEVPQYMERLFRGFYQAHVDLFTGNVLDAGCGGAVYPTVDLDKCKYIGIDLSFPELLKNTRMNFRICADVGALPVANSSIDLIICNDVIEHLLNPEAFFKEASSALSQQGVLLINTPSLYGYTAFLAKIFPRVLSEFIWRVLKRKKMPEYPFVYKANTKRAIHHLALDNGFSVQSITWINQVTHWFYRTPILATVIYAYGKLVSKIKMPFLLNCMMIVW